MKEFIKEIEQLTDINAHTEAFVKICELTENAILIWNANQVKTIHDRNNFIPFFVSQWRGTLYDEALALLKDKLSKEDFEALQNAI